jgi:preprotein translocase subunit YajC
MSAVLGAVVPLVGATKSSGSSSSILIFVVIGAAFYFLIYRPQQKKQKAARSQSNEFVVGDEVVTAGGIVGRVLDITDDRVTLETSVGASFVVLRPYVLRKLEPVEPPTDVVDGAEHDADEPQPPSGPPAVGAGDAGTDESADEPTDHASADASVDEATHDESTPTTPPPDAGDDTESPGPDGPPIV